jgi:hypothetical protein
VRSNSCRPPSVVADPPAEYRERLAPVGARGRCGLVGGLARQHPREVGVDELVFALAALAMGVAAFAAARLPIALEHQRAPAAVPAGLSTDVTR